MGTPLLWLGFNLFVLTAIALDLGVFHRKAHKVGAREAALQKALQECRKRPGPSIASLRMKSISFTLSYFIL